METDIIVYIASKLPVLDMYHFLTINNQYYSLYKDDYLWNYMGGKGKYFFTNYVDIELMKGAIDGTLFNTPKKRIMNIDNAHFEAILKKMVDSVDVTVNRLKLWNLTKEQAMNKYCFFKVYNENYVTHLKMYVGGDSLWHRTGNYIPNSKFVFVSEELLDLDLVMQQRTIQLHVPKLPVIENYIMSNIDEYLKFIQTY